MVLQAQGRISKRKDGKHFLYLPKSIVDDSAFPFKVQSSLPVRVVIDPPEGRILILSDDQRKRKLLDQVSHQLGNINPLRRASLKKKQR